MCLKMTKMSSTLHGTYYVYIVDNSTTVYIVDNSTTHCMARKLSKRFYFWISMTTLNDFSLFTASRTSTNIRR